MKLINKKTFLQSFFIFSTIFTLLPILYINPSFAYIKLSWNSIGGKTNNWLIDQYNSSNYTIQFSFSGTTNFWDIAKFTLTDIDNITISWSINSLWWDSSLTTNINTYMLSDWIITLSWSMINSLWYNIINTLTWTLTKNTLPQIKPQEEIISSSTWTNFETEENDFETKNITPIIISKKIVFTDIQNSFARDDIIEFVNRWIIVWNSDGTFKPNSLTSRAEFLAVVMKTLDINLISPNENEFGDIPEEAAWLLPYVIKAKELWIISGQRLWENLYFRPNDKINRAEALAILLNTSEIDLVSETKLLFTDVKEKWMKPYVIKWNELWIVSGQKIDGKFIFRPNDPITRAETVRIINKVLKIIEE